MFTKKMKVQAVDPETKHWLHWENQVDLGWLFERLR